MAKARAKKSTFTVKEMDLKQAQRAFNRKRGRGSKYDEVIDKAEKLEQGKALIVEGLSYSEVTGLRKRMADILGEDWSVSATKVDADKSLFDALVHREK